MTEPLPTPVLGVDQTRRGKPRWERCAKTGRWVRSTRWDWCFLPAFLCVGIVPLVVGLAGDVLQFGLV
ncbi:hypothetical protein GR254_07825 [Mycobacterium tuberculosis]|nr:hypothetical protein [Mycobacterium tuberculosis]